jgi:short-subunit dehydrogenase
MSAKELSDFAYAATPAVCKLQFLLRRGSASMRRRAREELHMASSSNKPLVLITGSSSGIGLELAKCFAKDGYDLIINSENPQKLARAADELRASEGSPNVEVIVADLATKEGPGELYEKYRALGREVDVFVNNAGVGVYGDFTRETELERELSMIQLNAVSCVQLTKRFAADFVKRGAGKILMTASVASVMPTPLQTIYGATKAFVYSFAEGLREELRDTGITVTALMPGATDTPFFARAGALDSKLVEGKLADPAEVAQAGYDAMNKGDDHVITPLSYRIQAAIGYVIPESLLAKISHKQHERKDA